MRDFPNLENKIESLKKDLKKLNELQDHLDKQRYDLWRECSQAHNDYEDLEKSKHDHWIECENHKMSLKLLKEKLLKNDALKDQPQDVVKLHKEINTLRETFSQICRRI